MQSTFWTNTIWYLALLMTSLVTVFLVMRKAKSRRFTLAFTLAVLGLVYILEYIIVVWFDSYSYFPKLSGDAFQDTVFGNMFSQISISATAALLIAYDLSLVWYFVFAVLYFLIEVLFVYLGIYQHHWYKSIYTLLALVPLFRLIKLWYYRVARTPNGWIYYLTLMFSITAVFANLIKMTIKLLNLQFYKVGIFNNLFKDDLAISAIIDLCLINILINLYRWKAHWVWKGIIFGALFLTLYLLSQIGVIYIKEGWFAAVTLLDLFGIYGFIVVIDHFLKQRDKLHADNQ